MVDCVRMPDVLLPAPGVDLSKWAVVACDQFTSQPEYWQEADRLVGDAPSTLRMVYPEAYLLSEEGDRAPAIRAAMEKYLADGVFAPARNGFILTERTTASGSRLGLMVMIDLTAYDFSIGSKSLIRPTEGTILDRIPPRVRVRRGAPLELPHVMLLADDPGRTLIEPIYAQRDKLELLYDFELMLGGGHLRGWAVKDADAVFAAMAALPSLQGEDPILFAVGDGNHSLATARQCYLDNPCQATRWAMAEVVNLYDESLTFEPIHRLIEGVDAQTLRDAAASRSIVLEDGDVRAVQPFLDEWLPKDAKVDYIHGEEALRELSAREGFCGIQLARIEKETLFPSLLGGRVLPRKAFSMGEATEKRYYMECRALTGKKVTLRPITKENFRPCISLDIKKEQRGYVAPNVRSLAQAWLYYSVARPSAIYADETLVGFVMLAWDEEAAECTIWRFMIDRKFQGMGYGKQAMQVIMDMIRANPAFKKAVLDYEENNWVAEKLYRSFGFMPTGEMMGDEVLMALNLRE